MSQLSDRESRLIAELEQELRTMSLDGSVPFDEVMGETRELLESQGAVLVKMRQTASAWTVELFHGAGEPSPQKMKREMTSFFSSAPPRFAWYNAASPEPAQRNRVLEPLSRIPRAEYESSLIYSNLLQPLGLEKHQQLRVLLCEGSALLAWFGAFIPDRVDSRQFEIMRRIAPSLRRRLAVEQRLREAPRLGAALEGALEHLGAPAFVLGPRGDVRELNQAGRALLDGSQAAEVSRRLRALATGRGAKDDAELVPLREQGRSLGWLAILRASDARGPLQRRLRTETHAVRWRLSPRQAQVLALLATGASNLRIGCEFGISERTVEDHVAAIFAKAQVATRAELIAEMIA